MEGFHIGILPLLSMCWLMMVPGNCQYQDMVCESIKSRHARQMTEPGPECDLSMRTWCSSKTASYPEEKILGILLDNRGIMKRLFGNSREAKFLETATDSFPDDAPSRPPPSRPPKRRKLKKIDNGKYHHTNILANSRHEPEDSFITDPTTILDQIDDLVITTEDGFTTERNEQNQNIPIPKEEQLEKSTKIRSSTPSSLDSGDDLRYTTKGSTAATTESLPQARPNTRNPAWTAEKLQGRMPPTQRRPYQSSNQGSKRHSQNKQSNYKPREDINIEKKKPQAQNIPPPYREKFPACNSTTEVIAPTWAKNLQGKNLIVVNVGSFMQHLHVEECERNSLHKKMFCQRGCRCEQQYRLQKLLVIDPDDECRGIFSDWFRFPSCCVCVCYPDYMTVTSRNGRIFEEEDEDYFGDEDEYEDDPFVLHYYGLDVEEEDDYDDENEDMLVSASQSDYIESNVSKLKRPNTISLERTFKTRSRSPINMTRASPEKKSRLLVHFNRSTINIRPQMAPRRYPPPRQYYNGPWGRVGWTQIANNKYPFANNFRRIGGLFSESRSAKTSYPSVSMNANVDTYFNQNKPTSNRNFRAEEKSNIFKRIPR